MNIQNSSPQINFQAKFLQSESLYQIVDYAIKHGKFSELNAARKVLETADPRTRVIVDICYTNKKPTVIFTHMVPNQARSGMYADEFVVRKQTDFIAKKADENPLKFALNQIINMAKNGTKGGQYKEIFVAKPAKNSNIWV